jgi:TRAP-type C4-dicarboxylate transport system substrate-binding protein
MTKTIRWIVSHEPIHLFLRTAEAFRDEIAKATDGEINVEIYTLSEYREKFPNAKLDNTHPAHFYKGLLECLADGEYEVTQTQVNHFGHYNELFRLLDLPFLFNSHEHCTEVLEGPVGQGLSSSLSKRGHGITGLAYTYSGGYRVIGSNDPITSVSDLQSKRIRTNLNPVNEDTMNAFGAEAKSQAKFPHLSELHGFDSVESGELDAAETTYLRFRGNHILKTNHSMFLTQIAVSDKFWNSLSAELQDKMRQAALAVSRLERKWSIDDAVEFEEKCTENGVAIHDISESDLAELKTRAKKVYATFDNMQAAKQLINKITLH